MQQSENLFTAETLYNEFGSQEALTEPLHIKMELSYILYLGKLGKIREPKKKLFF